MKQGNNGKLSRRRTLGNNNESKTSTNQPTITAEIEDDEEIDNSWLPYILIGIVALALLALIIFTVITLLPH